MVPLDHISYTLYKRDETGRSGLVFFLSIYHSIDDNRDVIKFYTGVIFVMTLIQLIRKSPGLRFTVVNHNTGNPISENQDAENLINGTGAIDDAWLDGTVERIGIQDGILMVSIQRKVFRNYYRNGQSKMVTRSSDVHLKLRKLCRDLFLPEQHLIIVDPVKQIGYDAVDTHSNYPFTDADELLKKFLDRRVDHIEASRKGTIRVLLRNSQEHNDT